MVVGAEETKTTAMERSTDVEQATNSAKDEDRPDEIGRAIEQGVADVLDVKCCRICLDGDKHQNMIAPCRCKGTSKWVHRECLDQWRAYNADDLAFSQCMECRFHFQFEENSSEKHRHLTRCLYWLLVSRDLFVATVVVQAFVLLFALIFFAAAQSEEGVIEWVDDSHNPICRSSGCQFWSCYAIGILVLFLLLGIYGSVLLCLNDCSLRAAVHVGGGGSSQRRGGGQTARGQPVVDGMVCGCDGDCNCCDCGCDGCGDSGEGAIVLLVMAVVIGAVLAIVGFVLAALLSVVVVQIIVRRHLWILQKKTLTKDYRVRDLSSDPCALSDSGQQTGGTETNRLVRLGLMEETD